MRRAAKLFAHRGVRYVSTAGASALHFKSIVVDGTLYPGDAAPYSVQNEITMPPPSNGKYSATMSFSNVPVHRNEWVVLTFTGVAADGSKVSLGELGGVVNVPSTSGKVPQLTVASTLTFQAFAMMVTSGEVSTWDLDNTPDLASKIHNAVVAAHVTPDPTTLLFNRAELATLYPLIARLFERVFRVKAPIAGSVLVVPDYTNDEEIDLQGFLSAIQTFFNEPFPKVGEVIGNRGCGIMDVERPINAPATTPLVPELVAPCTVPKGAGAPVVLSNAYGGHLLIGATNNRFTFPLDTTTPYVGGFTTISGSPPGLRTVTVPTGATQKTVATNDPAGYAFGPNISPSASRFIFVQPNFKGSPLGQTLFAPPGTFGRVFVPMNYSAVNNTVEVETFNPFDINIKNMEVCAGISCMPLSSNTTFTIVRPFADTGQNLTYFNWKPGGVATAVSQAAGGYNVTVSGAGTATLTTTHPSTLFAQQSVVIDNNVPSSQWTVTVTDTNGSKFRNFAFGDPTTAEVQMLSVSHVIQTKSITLSFTVPATGVYQISDVRCFSSGC